MAALNVLPKRRMSTEEAEAMLGLYQRHLGNMSGQQLTYMVDEAIKRHKFYPTVAELLEIAAEWQRDDEATRTRVAAEIALRRDARARLDDARARLRRTCWGVADQVTDDELQGWPEGWLRIFEAEGFLRRREDGSHFIARAGA